MARRDVARSGFGRATLDAEVERIAALDLPALRAEWRRLHRAEPPQLSRDLLRLALACRVQEIERGGLSRATQRKLEMAAKALRENGRPCSTPSVGLKLGARLLREWGGRLHSVTVVESGFLHEGVVHTSLTRIAEKITGAHWSGPRFFGLRSAKIASSHSDQPDG